MISKISILEAISIPDPKHIVFDGTQAIVYTDDDMPTQLQEQRIIKPWEFRDKFTQDELIAINRLAYIDGGDDVAILLLQKINTATDGVDLMSQTVKDGLSYLVFKGCLKQDRIQQILEL